jgi:hypothetical protein
MRKTFAWRAAQVLIACGAVWFAWRKLAPDWPSVVDAFTHTHVRAGQLVLSCAIVFASYAVLIETWRRVVRAWGSSMSFGTAARIWFVSNLAKWAPGRIWQITAMGALAHRAGVPPVAAVGSSLLIAIINVFAAGAVVLVTASDAIGLPAWAVALLGAAAVSLALIPQFVPGIARWAGARFGRDVSWPPIPYTTTIIAYAGCAIAWVLYGIAFQLMVSATFGVASGATRYYIAVFTASYIAGYLALVAPGGLVVREAGVIGLMTRYGMATLAGATVISVVSRVWLTILELVPGLILLALLPKGARSKANG